MDVEIVGRMLSTLPADDDHPYRTGAVAAADDRVARPTTSTSSRARCPADLDGVYLRNTENPVHPSLEALPPVRRRRHGPRRRLPRRQGLLPQPVRAHRRASLAEQEAGQSLWAGLAEPPRRRLREDGWGARGRMKDASRTDVVVHRGTALTSFYQCGDLYRLDPMSAETLGKATWNGRFPFDWGVSAHPKVDDRTGELLFFNYSKEAPYMHYGVVDEADDLVHYVDVPLPGPRLPHDMAFTENYAILNDFPLFWEPEALAKGAHVARFHRDMPTRFAVIPRRGQTSDIRWFEADPTYVLHFVNAYEDGDEIVLDGFFQGDPEPPDNGMGNRWERAFRFLALDRMQARLHRWRLNLRTGLVKEEQLSDSITEFGMMNGALRGREVPLRLRGDRQARAGSSSTASSSTTSRPGTEERYSFGDGVFGSETAMAPRVGSAGEDDGYLVTLDDRHERRRFVLPRVRRRTGLRRAGLPAPAARADLERHPLDVGARMPSCGDGARRRRQRMRSLSEPVVDDVGPGSVPTALEPGSTNAIGRMLGLLGDEWTLLILQRALRGTTRYGQFLDEVAISNAVLSARLATMEREGLLRRVVYQERPVRAEYVLTARGRGSLARHDRDLGLGASMGPAACRRRSPRCGTGLCGQDFAPVLTCTDVSRGRPLRRRARRVGAERVMGAVRAGVDDPTPVRPARRPVHRGPLPGDDVHLRQPVVLGPHRRLPAGAHALRRLRGRPGRAAESRRRTVAGLLRHRRARGPGTSRTGTRAGGRSTTSPRRDTPSTPSSRWPSTGRSTGMPPRRGRRSSSSTCRAGRRSPSRSPATSARPTSTAATSRSSRGRPVERTGRGASPPPPTTRPPPPAGHG